MFIVQGCDVVDCVSVLGSPSAAEGRVGLSSPILLVKGYEGGATVVALESVMPGGVLREIDWSDFWIAYRLRYWSLLGYV